MEILTLSIVHGQCVVITCYQRTEITHNTGCWNLAFFQFRFVKWTAARLLCSKTYRWEDVYLVISWNAKIERLVASYRIVEINLHQVSPVLFCNLVSWVVQQIIEDFYSLWQLDFIQLRIACFKQTQCFRRCCWCRTMCQIHHHDTLDIFVYDFIRWKSVFHLIAITRTLHEYGCKHRTVWIIFQKFCYLWPGHILARHLIQLLLNHFRIRRLEIGDSRNILCGIQRISNDSCWELCQGCLLCQSICLPATQFMVYGTVEPHTFLFQILFQGCLCCSLTAIYKTDILLTIMKYDAACLWIAFIQLVKDAWSHHTWDEVGWETELL